MDRKRSKSYSSHFLFPPKSSGTLWTRRVTVRPVPEAGEEGAPAAGAELGGGLAPQPRREPEL